MLSLSCSAFADTVWLNNGDRLTGEILLLDGGKLSFKTKYAGRVLIDWKDIDTLSADKPLMLRRTGRDSESSERLRAAGVGMVRVVNGHERVVALADIDRLVFGAVGHEAYRVVRAERPLDDARFDDCADILVEIRVEDERTKRRFRVPFGAGNERDELFEHFVDADPRPVCRGGNYFDVPGNARCAVRLGLQGPAYSDSRDGFRLCLGPPRGR